MPVVLRSAAAKLEKAIADVRAALDASGVRVVLQALRVDLLISVAGGAKLGVWAAHELHQNVEYGAMIGGAGALYRYIRKNIPKPISRCGALAYLGHAAQENLVKLPDTE